MTGCWPDLPAVTLREPVHVERVKNGLEVAPEDLLAALSPLPELVRLLGPDGALVGLAKTGQNARFSPRGGGAGVTPRHPIKGCPTTSAFRVT